MNFIRTFLHNQSVKVEENGIVFQQVMSEEPASHIKLAF